jgi:hypothetical protein
VKRAFILFGLLLVPAATHAQMPPTSYVNCANLRGYPLVCFKNNSPVPIIGIVTSSSMQYGTDWIVPPGDRCPSPISQPCIVPNGTSVIKLPSGWSGMRYIQVRKADGTTTTINHGQPVDIYNSTSIVIGFDR